MKDLDGKVRQAVQHFWQTRSSQSERQGQVTGVRDAGYRTAATGGAQLDGFSSLFGSLLEESGLPFNCVYNGRSDIELPGWFRPEKKWDLLVVADGRLLAALEFKSHIGPSFGNNYNNRCEEVVGNGYDLKAAYREGAFGKSLRPWVGYVMLLEDAPKSRAPVRNKEPHFRVFPEYRNASYAMRYEATLTKLVREELYDAACLLLSRKDQGEKTGAYIEPSQELSFRNLAEGLLARAIAHVRTSEGG